MKTLLVGLVLALASAAHAFDGPYFKKIYGADGVNFNASFGAVVDESGRVQNAAFTSVALVYHDADPFNTLVPENLQKYIPPEAWTLLSLGYGGGLAGVGASVNLAATAQGYVSQWLLASGSTRLEALGAAVKPGASSLSVNAGPEWFSTVVRDSTILPFDQWKGRPGWFIGGAYTKKFD